MNKKLRGVVEWKLIKKEESKKLRLMEEEQSETDYIQNDVDKFSL